MNNLMTVNELNAINDRIDEINKMIDLNGDDDGFLAAELDDLLSRVQSSYTKSRMLELGWKVIK